MVVSFFFKIFLSPQNSTRTLSRQRRIRKFPPLRDDHRHPERLSNQKARNLPPMRRRSAGDIGPFWRKHRGIPRCRVGDRAKIDRTIGEPCGPNFLRACRPNQYPFDVTMAA